MRHHSRQTKAVSADESMTAPTPASNCRTLDTKAACGLPTSQVSQWEETDGHDDGADRLTAGIPKRIEPWAGPKENIYALESLNGYIVSGCWELKRKFRFGRERAMKPQVAVLAAVAIISFAIPAFASGCEGKILLQPKFAQADPNWPVSKDETSDEVTQDGKLTIKVFKASTSTVLYRGDVYDDVQICVNVKLVQTGSSDEETAGVIFWAKDYNSYYSLSVAPDGMIAVSRWAGGRWLFPMPYQPNAAMKKGAGQINALRVVLRGSEATVYVNDQKIGSVTGQPAEGGSQVGIRAHGTQSTSKNTIWEFSDFVVSKP